MTGEGGEECELLADEHLARSGLRVMLDKGFAEGTYGVCIDYEELAQRVGFAAARRTARAYGDLLKDQLGRLPGYALGETEDPACSGGPARKRDLEATFLTFPIEASDGRFHDEAIKAQFRLAFLRAGQGWDQSQARAQTQRRHSREDRFRRQLAALLSSEVYAEIDATAKDRLLDDVTALAFPPRGIGP
jgi:hypothetical protein